MHLVEQEQERFLFLGQGRRTIQFILLLPGHGAASPRLGQLVVLGGAVLLALARE